MKIKMPKLKLRAVLYSFVAVAMAVAGLSPLLGGHASAGGQITSRKIVISTSQISATSTTYNVVYTPFTSGNIGGIVVDFCDNDPLIGDTSCTVPSGFTVTGSPTFTINSGIGVGGTWSAASLNSGQVFELSNSTAQAVSNATPVNFTINSVTNPSTINHTYYARILTFDTAAHMTSEYTVSTTTRAATFTDLVDFGGIALSTGSLIQITAKVQETLTFCVSGIALQPTNLTCTSATVPIITLGTGTPVVLDNNADYVGTAYTQVSTNANSGISMRMKASNTCANGGMSSNGGTTCNIPGVVGGSAASVQLVPGTAGFGLIVSTSANNATGSGTIAPAAPYDGLGGTKAALPFTSSTLTYFGMDGTGTTSTYGSVIASSSAPLSLTNNQLVFGATASLTTQAGIYTANEAISTTGTF